MSSIYSENWAIMIILTVYTKSLTFLVMWRFYLQKVRHFAKSKTICNTFLYTQIWHFCITQFFIEFVKFAEGGGIYCFKNNVLSLTFVYWKTMHFALRWHIQRAWHYALHFISQKQYTFLYVYKNIIYRGLTINARTTRSIRSKNKFKLFIENWSYSYDQ